MMHKNTTPTTDSSVSASPDEVVGKLISKQNQELNQIAQEIESYGAHYLGPIIEDDLSGLITFRDYNQFAGLPNSLQEHFHNKHSSHDSKHKERQNSRKRILRRAASHIDGDINDGLGHNNTNKSLDITKLLPKVMFDHYMKVYGYVRHIANQQKPQTSRIWLELFTDLIFVALIGML